MGKYQAKFAQEHIRKALITEHGGEVFKEQFKNIYNPQKNPLFKNKSLTKKMKLTTYQKNALQKAARGKGSLTEQELETALKTYKKVASQTEGVEIGASKEAKASADVAYKRIKKLQEETDQPSISKEQITAREKIKQQRIANIRRFYNRQDDIKKYGPIIGDQATQMRRGINTDDQRPGTSVNQPQDPQTSAVAGEQQQAQTSASSSDQPMPDQPTDNTQSEGTPGQNPASDKENTDTAPPEIAAGGSLSSDTPGAEIQTDDAIIRVTTAKGKRLSSIKDKEKDSKKKNKDLPDAEEADKNLGGLFQN
ncbi:hypothetical protein ACFL04_03295 [Patescibacteria group bacterium]